MFLTVAYAYYMHDTFMYTYIYIYTQHTQCIYMYMYKHMYVYVYLYIYIHKYKHTYLLFEGALLRSATREHKGNHSFERTHAEAPIFCCTAPGLRLDLPMAPPCV